MKFLSFFLLLISSFVFGQQREICFTIDDMPLVTYGISDTNYQKTLFNNLITSLKKNSIPAIGFINGKKLLSNGTINKFQIGLLTNWIDNGLEIGNHTYSHPDYNNVAFKDYADDIIKGEKSIKEISERRNLKIKYFRHPFLHVGNTGLKADSLSNFLIYRGYIVAPVTIDNDDYLFAVCYHRANVKNNKELMRQIGHDYVDYIEKKLKYYEKQSIRLFNRDIKQILLMHASLLNSVYIDSLAVMFRKNNYKFISLDETLKDSVYQTEITKYSNYGISWIDRWALSQGKKGDFFRDEPVTPEYIVKMAK